jgi:hypothetical protein
VGRKQYSEIRTQPLSTLQDVDKVEVVNLSKNRTEQSIENGLKDLRDMIAGNK